MRFDLTAPCKNCPFRTDITFYLTKARVYEIWEGITDGDATFACHKTVDYSEDGDAKRSDKEQHCAGALIALERRNRPNQMMRIAERLGLYDRTKLDMDEPVFNDADDMARARGSDKGR